MSKQIVDGYVYRYGDRDCVSLDRVVGSRPCKVELSAGLAVQEVKRRYVLDENGERVSLTTLLSDKLVRIVDGSLGKVERSAAAAAAAKPNAEKKAKPAKKTTIAKKAKKSKPKTSAPKKAKASPSAAVLDETAAPAPSADVAS